MQYIKARCVCLDCRNAFVKLGASYLHTSVFWLIKPKKYRLLSAPFPNFWLRSRYYYVVHVRLVKASKELIFFLVFTNPPSSRSEIKVALGNDKEGKLANIWVLDIIRDKRIYHSLIKRKETKRDNDLDGEDRLLFPLACHQSSHSSWRRDSTSISQHQHIQDVVTDP